MSPKDSMLDGFMKGLGKKLGARRREVHQAIERFNEEVNKDESNVTAPVAPKTVDIEATASTETENVDETKPSA
ncbi:hypothetical protein GC175_09460 [bacterium]|nr:hypothetical protein [bacterium]